MGVVNVTPDSFSDGGRFLDPSEAIAHAHQLTAEGADILDIGGESTRPGADPVPEEIERQRVLPVVERLAGEVGLPISIDTMKPGLARDAVVAGASIINDVGANRPSIDPLIRVVAETGAGYVCMHMRGTPRTMQEGPRYGDVVGEIEGYFQAQLTGLSEAGVDVEQVVLDVGLGFGKTLEHNLQLLAALERFTRLGRPLMIGASRKSFIGKVLETEPRERLAGSLACACWGVGHGASIIRVHDVRETVQAIRMNEAISRQLPGSNPDR
jgi:dihydropteroate synthase